MISPLLKNMIKIQYKQTWAFLLLGFLIILTSQIDTAKKK